MDNQQTRMRRVMLRSKKYIEGKYVYEDVAEGVFHQWGLDILEFQDSAASYTVALIEMPDGTIISATADCVRFLSS